MASILMVDQTINTVNRLRPPLLKKLNISAMTPFEALNLLNEPKRLA
jgi:hypothetical protein